MAVHSIKVRRCDVCEGEGAARWFVQTPDLRRVEVDLCTKHATPLQVLVPHGRPGRVARSAAEDGMVVESPAPRRSQTRPKKVDVKFAEGEQTLL